MTAAMIAVGGCSSGERTDKPDNGNTATPQPSVELELRDQSAKLLEAKVPEAQGSVDGEVGGDPAALTVAEVRVVPSGTRLTFWYAGASKSLLGHGEGFWETLPRLVNLAGERIYDPVTFTKPDGTTYCVCTDAAYIGEQPLPRTVLYPKLPDNVTEIQVRQSGFEDPITISVTRQ